MNTVAAPENKNGNGNFQLFLASNVFIFLFKGDLKEVDLLLSGGVAPIRMPRSPQKTKVTFKVTHFGMKNSSLSKAKYLFEVLNRPHEANKMELWDTEMARWNRMHSDGGWALSAKNLSKPSVGMTKTSGIHNL